MNNPLQYAQKFYHAVLPEERRLSFYKSAPPQIRRLLDRLGRQAVAQTAENRYNIPTKEDIYYCYRLLLNRDPTPEESATWYNHVVQYGFDLDRLVHDFMHSDDYVRRRASLDEPYLVDAGPFKIFVRLNDYSTGRSIAQYKSYEANVAEQIRQRLSPGDIYVDIGANIGFHALLAASIVGPTGRILAFEPHPSNCELLRLSAAENNFDQFELIQKAVGSEEGELELLITGSHSNARLQTAAGTGNLADRTELVQVVRLDDYLAGIDRIDMIKIDIEGAEALAWQGMTGLLAQHRPAVLTEFFPDFIRLTSRMEPEAYLQLMLDSDYTLHFIHWQEGPTPPLSIEEIFTLHQQANVTHIDLLALPKNS